MGSQGGDTAPERHGEVLGGPLCAVPPNLIHLLGLGGGGKEPVAHRFAGPVATDGPGAAKLSSWDLISS